jgi:hypothetical protein
MTRHIAINILVFILGMVIYATGAWFASTFLFPERPTQDGMIEDWDQICFWPGAEGLYLSISPKGCFSTSCTSAKLQTSSAVVDLQNQKIQLDARFVLVRASRFPLPCIENCSAGMMEFKLDNLIPNDYEVWFKDKKVGNLMIFSGRPTSQQCFEKN